jgi:metal-responsive CopG/Arc/MetJ family transcriptional regulator
MRKNYATVKIPTELSGKLDSLIPELGYHSRAEIVNDAIRRFIEARSRFDEKEPSQFPVPTPLIRSNQK